MSKKNKKKYSSKPKKINITSNSSTNWQVPYTIIADSLSDNNNHIDELKETIKLEDSNSPISIEEVRNVEDILSNWYNDTAKTKKRIFIIWDTNFFSLEDESIDTIISNWNEVVNKDDLVIHLGDFTSSDNLEKNKELLTKLNWIKILVRSIMDFLSYETYLDLGFSFILDQATIHNFFGYNIIFSHTPLASLPVWYINIHSSYSVLDEKKKIETYSDYGYIYFNYNKYNKTPVKLNSFLSKNKDKLWIYKTNLGSTIYLDEVDYRKMKDTIYQYNKWFGLYKYISWFFKFILLFLLMIITILLWSIMFYILIFIVNDKPVQEVEPLLGSQHTYITLEDIISLWWFPESNLIKEEDKDRKIPLEQIHWMEYSKIFHPDELDNKWKN